MGISLYTAMVIQNNKDNVKCSATKNEEGKWSGEISLWKGDFPHTSLITTNFNYDSREEAVDDMKKIIDVVHKADLFKEVRKNMKADEERDSAGSDNKG